MGMRAREEEARYVFETPPESLVLFGPGARWLVTQGQRCCMYILVCCDTDIHPSSDKEKGDGIDDENEMVKLTP